MFAKACAFEVSVRTAVGVRAIGWERASALARRQQHRSRWHNCAGGIVEDQYLPEHPRRSRCVLPSCVWFYNRGARMVRTWQVAELTSLRAA
eukprot:5533315-Pleurochrysis_carterae.AAC.1